MRGYSPNYGHYVAYARPPARLHRAVPSHKDRQVALRRPVALIPPEVLEPIGRKLGVPDCVLDVFVPEIGLQRPGVAAGIG